MGRRAAVVLCAAAALSLAVSQFYCRSVESHSAHW